MMRTRPLTLGEVNEMRRVANNFAQRQYDRLKEINDRTDRLRRFIAAVQERRIDPHRPGDNDDAY